MYTLTAITTDAAPSPNSVLTIVLGANVFINSWDALALIEENMHPSVQRSASQRDWVYAISLSIASAHSLRCGGRIQVANRTAMFNPVDRISPLAITIFREIVVATSRLLAEHALSSRQPPGK